MSGAALVRGNNDPVWKGKGLRSARLRRARIPVNVCRLKKVVSAKTVTTLLEMVPPSYNVPLDSEVTNTMVMFRVIVSISHYLS